jgi:thiol-disulfide isomerase/thioredoxin
MISRKRIKTSRYVAALAITLVIFLIGFIIGGEINERKIDALYSLEQDIRVESLSNELVFQLVQKDLCGSMNMSSYTEELAQIGRRLTYMEGVYGYEDPRVVRLKSYYSLLQVRHWLLSDEVNAKCSYDKPLIVYFYTNDGCGDCEDQGLVLTNLYRHYPLFNTYSMEYSLDNPALAFLKERYGIERHRLPTLVVNGEVLYGFQDKDSLVERLELERRLAEDMAANPERYE